jgi:hypothetical protein
LKNKNVAAYNSELRNVAMEESHHLQVISVAVTN